METFPYHRWWKKLWKRFFENRRLVVCTEIVSPLVTFLISVEVEKFPRASSSSAGRPGQVAADRARAGEKFLMAHFPASLSMNRLAGSSGTQKVCEATKSRYRTGSVISKSGRSGLSQMPAAMTQRGLKHQSERRQLKVSGGVPRGRRCPKPCCCYVSSRAHRKLPALPPRGRQTSPTLQSPELDQKSSLAQSTCQHGSRWTRPKSRTKSPASKRQG